MAPFVPANIIAAVKLFWRIMPVTPNRELPVSEAGLAVSILVSDYTDASLPLQSVLQATGRFGASRHW